MDIMITGRNVKVTEGLRTHITEKIVRLEKYDPKIVEAKVVLKVEKFRHLVEITLVAKHVTLLGNGKSNDLYTSLDTAVDRLTLQLKRMRDRIKDQRIRSRKLKEKVLFTAAEQEARGDEEKVDEEIPLKIIRARKTAIKPMSLEEAKAEIAMMENTQFIVFRNQDTMKINVLYRMEQGNLGLIEEA